MTLARCFDKIADPPVLFEVMQSCQKTMNDAMTATLELESFKSSKPCSHKEIKIEQPDESKMTVGVIGPPFSNQSPDWSTWRVELLDQMWDSYACSICIHALAIGMGDIEIFAYHY